MENINLNNIKGKKAIIVGMGKSGIAAAQAMLKLGASVTIQDSKDADSAEPQLVSFFGEKGVEFCLGKDPENLEDFDIMILSPGVDPEIPMVKRAEKAGVEIIGELEIAYRIARGRFVAITGTNGKTTTTTLTGDIFRKAGRSTYVVGNIGVAVISKALDASEEDWLVTETSSFQLQTIKYFKPVISAVLNVTPDHLNRHHTMENYRDAKGRIYENQDREGYCVLNAEDEMCRKLAERCPARIVWFSSERELEEGAFVRGGDLVIADREKGVSRLCGRDELRIIGKHNVENALAAAAISYYAGIAPDVIGSVLKSFTGVAHRIEYCGELNGVKFYNDSKGTNVDAAVTAINAIEKNIILIAGGDGKGQDFRPLIENFRGRVKHMVLLGRDGPMIGKTAEELGFKDFTFASDMGECVRKAAELAEEGDSVLLSPACASWDMYDNFEQRGDHFKELVAKMGV